MAVNGNGKIVQEIRRIIYWCGLEVIKVLWEAIGIELFAKDTSGKLTQLMMEVVDATI